MPEQEQADGQKRNIVTVIFWPLEGIVAAGGVVIMALRVEIPLGVTWTLLGCTALLFLGSVVLVLMNRHIVLGFLGCVTAAAVGTVLIHP